MKIYRVENRDGEGIYAGGGSSVVWGSGLADDQHPMPYRDGKLIQHFKKGFFGGWVADGPKTPSWQIRFGFSSKAQLLGWLFKKDWRIEFEKLGYSVGVYDAPGALRGYTQAVFNKRTAKKIATIKLTEI